MPRYTLQIFLANCLRIHPTKIELELDEGPTKRDRIGLFFWYVGSAQEERTPYR
jgi:hypothetical protein